MPRGLITHWAHALLPSSFRPFSSPLLSLSSRRSLLFVSLFLLFSSLALFYLLFAHYSPLFLTNFPAPNVADSCCFNCRAQEEFDHFPASNTNYRFITNHPNVSFCSGLGNQLFRFASLYGIGKMLGRQPVYGARTKCAKAELFSGEMHWIFPALARNILYISPPHNETHFAKKFASRDCCHWDDPMNLSSVQTRYLALGAIYLQNYRYFHKYREDIRQIFRFSPDLCAQMHNYARELFSADQSSHKLCVHTRRGDFFNRQWESTKEFVENAVHFAITRLRRRFKMVSVVLMGEDKQFLHNLNISEMIAHRVYIPRQQSRDQDMALALLGVLFCNSLVITASASTFAWWMGYLMRTENGGGTVFFNANFTGMQRDRANFLPEWIPILKFDQ